jgi:hypothetical protein
MRQLIAADAALNEPPRSMALSHRSTIAMSEPQNGVSVQILTNLVLSLRCAPYFLGENLHFG